MKLIRPSTDEAKHMLQAMKSVAIADGAFESMERELLDSIQEHLFQTDFDLDALPESTPDAIAEGISSPSLRNQLIEALVLTSLANGHETEEKASLIERYAKALNVENHLIRDMKLLLHDHLMMFRFDLMRRTRIAELAKKMVKEEGFRGVVDALKIGTGHGFDLQKAQQYQRLGLLPEGSVGRTYWTFHRENGFSFPGEPHGPPEPLVRHDLNHVLGGYAATGADEINVAAYQAGQMSKDPFSVLIFAICQFHIGVRITPIAPAEIENFQADEVIRSLIRGTKVTQSTFDPEWDPMSIMALTLEEAREQLNIEPRTHASEGKG